MTIDWKVSHHLQTQILYQSGPTIYPTLGVTLILQDSAISQVDHKLSANDQLSETDVIELSTQQLAVVWELINYRWGYPVQVAHRSVERLGPALGASLTRTHLQTITARAAIVHPIQLPEEASLLRSETRLRVWLRLANDARPPTHSVDAIRYYYMVWEDMHGRPGRAAAGSAEEELKFIRDFVSHGEELTYGPLLTFLKRKLGKETKTFDPHDPLHQNFVEQRREWARMLVESQIDKHL